MQFEGEESPQPTLRSALALRAWRQLSTGMGAWDWHGMPAVIELLGVPDDEVELMLHLLEVIKTHRPDVRPAAGG